MSTEAGFQDWVFPDTFRARLGSDDRRDREGHNVARFCFLLHFRRERCSTGVISYGKRRLPQLY